MAFNLFYNEHFPLRLVNFITKYLDLGGVIHVNNKIARQLSKLQVIDTFFPSLFIRTLSESAYEAEYDYETCYIYALVKQGVLSNWGSYKQKINNLEDCLLGNNRNDGTYRNYTAAQNMLRRAVTDLVSDDDYFSNILFNLQSLYEEQLGNEQKQLMNEWISELLEQCEKEETIAICTTDRTDGFSFEPKVYMALLRKVSAFYKEQDFKNCWAWFCLGSLFGNYTDRLINRYYDGQLPNINSKHNSYSLVPSPSVLANPLFLGRDNYLKQINQMFSSGERIIFLYGISGIGKTEIAKKYANLFRNNYDVIIFAVYENSIKKLFISETPFETDPPIYRLMIDGRKEDDDSYFKRKLSIIKKTANERTLIILDNYNTNNDEYLDEMLNGRYHVLITTQYDYSRIYPSIKVCEFENMDVLKELFMKNYRGYTVEKDDPHLAELIRYINCHTYTVVLLAHHMENSGQSTTEMLEILRNQGISSLDKAGNGYDTVFHHLTSMFRIVDFNEEEQRILQFLSLMPYAGIPPMVFAKWAEMPSVRILIFLEQRGWIIRSTNGITLHPIIQQVVHHTLPVNTEKIKPFLDNAAAALSNENSWHYTKNEKEKYCFIARSILSIVKEIDENTFSFFVSAAGMLGFSGYPDNAISIDKQLYQYCCEHEGINSFETARSAFRLGWVYLFNLQLENAVENSIRWMLIAADTFGKITLDSVDQRSTYCAVICNLSKAYMVLYRTSGNPEHLSDSARYAEQAVEYSMKWLDNPESLENKKSPAGSLLRLADVKIEIHEYELADKTIDKASSYLHAINPDYNPMDPDILSINSKKALISYHLGNYAESLAQIEKNLAAYRQFYGGDNAAIVDQMELKIKNCIKLGDIKAAQAAKKEALEFAQKIYSDDSVRLRILNRLI